MKKFITFIFAIMALTLPLRAQDSDGNTQTDPIILESHPIDDRPNHPVHRAPMRIPVEAWYDASASTISIIYYGEATGEVNLYRDGTLIETSSEINTTFRAAGSGFYTVEIITEYWTATGSTEI